MKMVLRGICVAVFLIGLVVYSKPQSNDVEPARSFVVTMEHYRIVPDGSRTDLAPRVVFVKANGEARVTPYDPNSGPSLNRQASSTARVAGEGLFATAAGVPERELLSSNEVALETDRCFRSASCLRGNRRFVRTEELAGLLVYVFHDNAPPDHPYEWLEQSYSPKTGFVELRKVVRFKDGHEDVLNATSVEFKSVPDDLNDDIKAMPIRKQ